MVTDLATGESYSGGQTALRYAAEQNSGVFITKVGEYRSLLNRMIPAAATFAAGVFHGKARLQPANNAE